MSSMQNHRRRSRRSYIVLGKQPAAMRMTSTGKDYARHENPFQRFLRRLAGRMTLGGRAKRPARTEKQAADA